MSRVIIVEDDARFRKRLRKSLASRFPSLIFSEAVNGKQAFLEIDSSRPAFIFMDISLGDDNGLELTKEIKDLYPEVFISVLTNYDFPEYRDAAFQNGADFFLVKGSATLHEIAELLETTLYCKDNHKTLRAQPTVPILWKRVTMESDFFTTDDLNILMAKQGESCVSIFMPTHRVSTEIEQDKIRFKNLLRKAKKTFRDLEPDGHDPLEPAERLQRDSSFWMHQSSGLASFLSAGLFLHYCLPISFKELVVVTDSFHLKPLLPLVGEECSFYILALSQNETRLFKGNRFNAREIEVSSIPASIKEALKYDDPEKQLQFHTGTSATGKRPAMYHGHGVGTDDSKDNILRYLRQIDRGLQNLLTGEYSPLVVAGVEYLISLYREASIYPYLLGGEIRGNPEGLSAEELHQQGWEIVQPDFEKGRRDAEKRYYRFAGTGKATNNLTEVLPATFHGRVEILFVADGMEQWGRYDPVENTLELHRKLEPGDQDLLNLAAVQTFANGGTVYLAEPGEVPGDGLVAALFRY